MAKPTTRVYATTAANGIYLDKDGRHDLKVPKGSAEVELVAVDPGALVPVQAATVPLSMCQDPATLATYLATNERAFFSVNKAKWDKKSGRTEGVAREAQARATDPVYEAYCKARRIGPQEDRQPRQLPHLPQGHPRACQFPHISPPQPNAGRAQVARSAHADARACAPGQQDLGDVGG